MRHLISSDDSARRVVAAPSFAQRISFSFFVYFTLAPHRDADSCSGSVSARLPEDVAALQCLEVLFDCKRSVLESAS